MDLDGEACFPSICLDCEWVTGVIDDHMVRALELDENQLHNNKTDAEITITLQVTWMGKTWFSPSFIPLPASAQSTAKSVINWPLILHYGLPAV
jgi:hypothetical protein